MDFDEIMRLGFVILITIILFGSFIAIFTFAWNEVIPFLFGLPKIDYWKTIMLWLVVIGLANLKFGERNK